MARVLDALAGIFAWGVILGFGFVVLHLTY